MTAVEIHPLSGPSKTGKRKSAKCGKKHRCKDCSFCQWCSDSRCDVCRCKGSKYSAMSFEEQIAIYEKINKHA